MAIFKPETTSAGTGTPKSSYLGAIEVGPVGFKDRSGDFPGQDWAEIFLEIELSVKGSEYTNKMSLLGRLDKDGEGKIVGGSVLKRMYNIFEMIGFKGGLTIDKKWEDDSGNEITNIAEHLNNNFKTTNQEFIAYAYKKKPKKPGDKVYTEMWPKLWLNTEGGRMQCDKDIKWLKENGYLKEASQDDFAPKGQTNLADNALANL